MLVLWVVFSEYHEHQYSSPVWNSCVIQPKQHSGEDKERQGL